MRRRIVWINLGLALLLVAAGAGAYFAFFAPKEEIATGGRTVAVQQGAVSETVTATGTVATAGTIELSFPTGGVISKVKVEVGDSVTSGKKLVTLDRASAEQNVAAARSTYVQAVNGKSHNAVATEQAQLSVSQAQQQLADAKKNADLNKTTYQLAVDKAEADLRTAKSSWSDACLDPAGSCPDASAWSQLRAAEADVTTAQTAYQQAVQNATDSQGTDAIKVNQANVSLAHALAKQGDDCTTYGSSSTQCASAKQSYLSAQQQLELAQNSQSTGANQAQQSLVNADAKVTQANIALKKLQSSLAKTGKDSVRAAQEALDSAQQSQKKGRVADEQAIVSAQQAVTTAQMGVQAATTGSGATSSSNAQIAAAKASLDTAEQSLADTVLRAPIAGRIATVDATEGALAQAGAAMVTLLPNDAYEVKAQFSEADALKLKTGQKATITFDALSGETATGTVTAIDIEPTTSTTSSVTTYGATVTLDQTPEGLKEGMSASVVVTTNEVSDALWVPTAAITTAGGKNTVVVRSNGKDTTVEITTGLAGDAGTEVTSGLKAGDQVVISTATIGGSGFPQGGFPGAGTGGGPPGGGANRTAVVPAG